MLLLISKRVFVYRGHVSFSHARLWLLCAVWRLLTIKQRVPYTDSCEFSPAGFITVFNFNYRWPKAPRLIRLIVLWIFLGTRIQCIDNPYPRLYPIILLSEANNRKHGHVGFVPGCLYVFSIFISFLVHVVQVLLSLRDWVSRLTMLACDFVRVPG